MSSGQPCLDAMRWDRVALLSSGHEEKHKQKTVNIKKLAWRPLALNIFPETEAFLLMFYNRSIVVGLPWRERWEY